MKKTFRIIKKLIPQKVDMLIYYFPKSTTKLPVPEVDGAPLVQIGNEYLITSKEILIHRSRVFFNSNLLNNFNFAKPYVIIGDCLTDDRFRGKGIYPLVIQYLAQAAFPLYQTFILVSPDNVSSIKGIEKAGFLFMARLQGLRIFNFYVQKKITIWKP
jgi:hypothetical protein|uniref:hypothetical protein n=1 Tax=Algoriphagus sp. TaxID=1872435 RepID=UPI002582A656|nr:hypothetical protein [Algoriphagus sp.]